MLRLDIERERQESADPEIKIVKEVLFREKYSNELNEIKTLSNRLDLMKHSIAYKYWIHIIKAKYFISYNSITIPIHEDCFPVDKDIMYSALDKFMMDNNLTVIKHSQDEDVVIQIEFDRIK
jgi:hypothetical protein